MLKSVDLKSYIAIEKLKKDFELLKSSSLHRYAEITKSVDVSGDNVLNAKNAHNVFDSYDIENVKYAVRYFRSKDGMDILNTTEGELIYEYGNGGANSYSLKFSNWCFSGLNNIEYSDSCHSSSNLFGCVGLRNKQCCILNKQYTKEGYETLVPKIIAHMNEMPYIDTKGRVYKYGEFFPSKISPFAYNETIAQEHFPLTKEQALEQGYSWKDPEERHYAIDIAAVNLPDRISDITNDIVGEVIECAHQGKCNEQCTTAFKVIKEELQFYQKMNLPLPRLCPNCRHYERLKQRNPLKLWHRQCMCDKKHSHHSGRCPNEFETAYAPDRPEIIYCEKCYNLEVA